MKLSETEEKVYDWLKDVLGLLAFADIFHGAAIFMKEKPPGYINFVSHAGRGIMNSLAPAYLDEKSGVGYLTLHSVTILS